MQINMNIFIWKTKKVLLTPWWRELHCAWIHQVLRVTSYLPALGTSKWWDSFRKPYFWQQLIFFQSNVTERANYGLPSSLEINKEWSHWQETRETQEDHWKMQPWTFLKKWGCAKWRKPNHTQWTATMQAAKKPWLLQAKNIWCWMLPVDLWQTESTTSCHVKGRCRDYKITSLNKSM